MIPKARIIRTIAALARRSSTGIYGPFVRRRPTEAEISLACNADRNYTGLRKLIYVSPIGELSIVETAVKP